MRTTSPPPPPPPPSDSRFNFIKMSLGTRQVREFILDLLLQRNRETGKKRESAGEEEEEEEKKEFVCGSCQVGFNSLCRLLARDPIYARDSETSFSCKTLFLHLHIIVIVLMMR